MPNKIKVQLFCTLFPSLFLLAASNNPLALWNRVGAPERLSNSPRHLRGQDAGAIMDWHLRSNMCDYWNSDTFGSLTAL
jgi:hypothetical protein